MAVILCGGACLASAIAAHTNRAPAIGPGSVIGSWRRPGHIVLLRDGYRGRSGGPHIFG